MTDTSAWQDQRKEAQEYESAAKKAAKEAAAAMTAGDASSIDTENAHAGGHGETVFFDFRPPAGIPAEQARDHLEQIEDNNEAISAITMALSTISLLTMKPRCETCGQWHDILANGRNVGGLYSAIHALTYYSNLLAHDIRQGVIEDKEAEPEQ